MIHGHFLLMGGVIFSVNGNLEYLDIWKLLRDDESSGNQANDNEANRSGPKNEAEKYAMARKELRETLPLRNIEIRDRSKADIITKGLTFVQTLWFIVNLGVRRAQNLTVTALEVITLAYAVTTIFAYIFWQDKPLHVQNPIVIPLSIPPVDETTNNLPSNQSRDQDVLSGTPSHAPGVCTHLALPAKC